MDGVTGDGAGFQPLVVLFRRLTLGDAQGWYGDAPLALLAEEDSPTGSDRKKSKGKDKGNGRS